ncbi:GntR family transcriptional regulator [Vibrio tubiashii]|mgnify:CR=1 FL=1|uniref:GntR family transcriptional regulator n=2 Tax=Vibrio tubiashii TaxID=29498 RepID=F9T520_9VIBR|nr:GntR family transcriptional regulator [Vibrio tubiashii]AIW15703.1 GntR family transcriptional regulator [Vibrio tubiashii ATCC 19109]EGU55377.1 GntR family transcriptional regulator [Vibrio tubiashii ATCC 19109]EIF01999.1 GntR family transcriptional regulator [Vibrio tubiashii NCIMB 1337 = ATCC 19106]MCG9575344.1 GntR family transcriptional regulator [Vibrio tubiashii]NOI79845.1 GntR family transcriptional regulator [Vibrio tubiashii]
MANLKNSVAKNIKTKVAGQTQDDVVYCHIFDAILEQRLPPATKLNEEALAEIFSVSRTIIRRALLRLSMEQVVSIRPNRGAMVAAPTKEEAKQIIKAREVMELAITELAVEHATPAEIDECRRLVEKENEAFDNGDYGKGLRLSGEFHIKLAEIANNAPLLAFQRSLVSQTSLLIAQYETGNHANCSLDEHTVLLDAIEAGKTEQAVELMRVHIDHIRSKLNLDSGAASNDLHVVFSDLIKGR